MVSYHNFPVIYDKYENFCISKRMSMEQARVMKGKIYNINKVLSQEEMLHNDYLTLSDMYRERISKDVLRISKVTDRRAIKMWQLFMTEATV